MQESPANTVTSAALRDAAALVQAIGQSLNVAMLYGMSHKVTRASLDRSGAALRLFLELYGHLDVNVADGSLLINGTPNEAPLAGAIAARLAAQNLLCCEITQGLTLDEYAALFTILLTPPAQLGGPAASRLNEAGGFSHIQARSIEYRRVVEGEAAPGAAPAPAAPAPDTPPAASAHPPDLDNILAFLKDDHASDAHRSADDIRQLAGDSEKLAELILRTVEVRASAANVREGESLTDIVVSTIGKMVSALTPPAAVHSEKGRKQVKRSLMILEKVVLQRLQQIAGNESSEAAAAFFDEAVESLDVEAMASKFVKTRRAANEAGLRLRRLIAAAGDDPEQLDALHAAMVRRGLPEEGWQDLLISRDPLKQGGDGASASELADIKTLTLLLAKLGETLSQSRPTATPEELHVLAGETHCQMEKLASRAERKILALRQMLGREAVGASGKPEELSRRQLLECLAEIGQEFSQPLTVLSASVDMLRGQRAGPLTESQAELVNMTFDSTARLAHLADCLIRIAGNPKTTHPDQAILNALYDTKTGDSP